MSVLDCVTTGTARIAGERSSSSSISRQIHAVITVALRAKGPADTLIWGLSGSPSARTLQAKEGRRAVGRCRNNLATTIKATIQR